MGKSVMRIETMTVKSLMIISIIGMIWILIALIIGAAGPQEMLTHDVTTYKCPDDEHQKPCVGGFSLADGRPFDYKLEPLAAPNRFWAVDVFPFLKPGASAVNLNEIRLITDIYYLTKDGYQLLRQDRSTFPFTCLEGSLTCFGFTLVDEPEIQHTTYRIVVTLEPGAGNNTAVIGDTLFRFFRQDESYSTMSVVVRAVYGIVVLIILAYSLYRYNHHKFSKWTLEQRWSIVLLAFLFLMNNPLYFTEIYSNSLFWPVLTALFESVFIAVFIFFSLIYIDALRHGEDSFDWKSKWLWLKAAAVFVYFCLSLSLFIWQEAVLVRDPIINRDITGPSILFYIVSLVYAVLIVWLGVQAVLLLPRANSNARSWVRRRRRGTTPTEDDGVDEAATETAEDEDIPDNARASSALRMLHAVVPIAVVVISTIIGVFSGSFGPFGRTAVGLWYYHTLYNAVILYWLYGWWPVSSGKSRLHPHASTERAPLVASFPTQDIDEASELPTDNL